jgi:molecular chaperone HscB
LNDAYRTLKQPISRTAYLLELEGVWMSADKGEANASKQVPPALLEEVFALNEELDEVRSLRESGAPVDQWRSRLQRAAKPIEAKRAEHEQQLQSLAARWDILDGSGSPDDRKAVLNALRDRMLERNYINNLLGTIDRELSGSGLQAPGSGQV